MSSRIWPTCETTTHRLSKPRTNTSSSNLLSLASQQLEGSSPRSPTNMSLLSDDPVVTSQTGDRRTRRKSRSKIRTYLQGSGNEHAQENSSEDEGREQRGIVNGVKKRISRRSSSLSRLTHRRRSSIPLASAASSRLMLNDDEPTRMEQEIMEKEYAGRIAAQNHVTPSVDEDDDPITMKSPIRRRSLYTPGLATRTPHDILRRPPPPDRRDSELERQYYYNPNKPQSSPLSDLATLAASRNAALASSNDGRSTPVNLAQLGGLSLGTLRITNGAASPEPSHHTCYRSIKAMSDSASHEEYYTASEGCKSEDEAQSIRYRRINDTMGSPRRTGSPLKFETQCRSGPHIRNIGPRDGTITHVEEKPYGYPEQGFENQRVPEGPITTPRAADRASSMAQEYMLELPPSPYGAMPSNANKPEDQSCIDLDMQGPKRFDLKQSESSDTHDYRGFQDEGVDLSGSRPCTADYWRFFVDEAEARHAASNTTEDAYRILNGGSSPRNSMMEQPNYYLESDSGDREDEDRRGSTSTTTTNATNSGSSGSDPRAALSGTMGLDDTDSGYNSYSSLNATGCETSTSSLSPGFLRGYQKDHRSVSGRRDMPQQPLRGTEVRLHTSIAPPRPSLTIATRPATTVTVTTLSSPVIQRQHTAPSGQLPLAQPNHVASPDSLDVSPNVETSSPHPPSATASHHLPEQQLDSTRFSPTKSRKLQKLRSSSKSTPVDQITIQRICELTETTIPPIPVAIASKHAERLRVFPSLEHTFPSSHHTSSDDSRTPSPDRPLMPIRFPSPSPSMDDRSDAIVNGNLDWPTKPKQKTKELARPKSSRFRRKSQVEPLPSIADFGDVAIFLGGSPYDAAKPGNAARFESSSNEGKQNLHQISTTVSRPKSMVAMNEGGATQHGRRSIFRPQTPDPDKSHGNCPLPGRKMRPQSVFANASLGQPIGERGRRQGTDEPQPPTAQTDRPNSVFVDVPPVPRLPSLNHAKKLESKARKLRSGGGPAIPDIPSSVEAMPDKNSTDRPVKLDRPQIMYDVVPTKAQLQGAQTDVDYECTSTPVMHPFSTLEKRRPQSISQPHLERSDTVIHHGSKASNPRISRPKTMYAKSPAMPVQVPPSTECSQRWSQQYIDELNLHHPNAASNKPESSQQIVPMSDGASDSERLITTCSPAPNKLLKKRPGNAKPDLWKSDSLKEELTKRQEDINPKSNSDESEVFSQSSSIWENPKLSGTRRQELAGAAFSLDGFSVGQIARPFSAPSIHGALSLHKRGTPKTIERSHLDMVHLSNSDSSSGSVKSRAASLVQPSTFYYDVVPGIAPRAPIRAAVQAPSVVAHENPVEEERSATSYLSTTSQPQTPKKSNHSQSPASSGSSRRTPKSNTRSSSKQQSPTISSPTANAADSYNSHAEAAPPPPAFSIPRKRVGSLPLYAPQPSARSLKPIPASRPSPSAAASTVSLSQPSNLSSANTASTAPTSTNPSSIHLPGGPLSSHPTHPIRSSTTAAFNSLDPLYPPSRFENLSGRYQGGLQYGYEPGVGLGGSSGTRQAKNGAARKSVDVSKNYGLDLSDVPIFVAPADRAPWDR